jgi:hypothetical protein
MYPFIPKIKPEERYPRAFSKLIVAIASYLAYAEISCNSILFEGEKYESTMES